MTIYHNISGETVNCRHRPVRGKTTSHTKCMSQIQNQYKDFATIQNRTKTQTWQFKTSKDKTKERKKNTEKYVNTKKEWKTDENRTKLDSFMYCTTLRTKEKNIRAGTEHNLMIRTQS